MAKGKLVLTRRVNESVVICDGDIVVTIREIKGNRVSIAFEADREIEITRQELFEKRTKKEEMAA